MSALTVEELLARPEPPLLTAYVHGVAILSALGDDLETTLERLAHPESLPGEDAHTLGRLPFEIEPLEERPELADFLVELEGTPDRAVVSTRLWRTAYRALKPLADRLSAKEKLETALVFGTATAGLPETIASLAERPDAPLCETLSMLDAGRPAALLAAALGLFGPVYTVSTACTSGGKAIADGARLIAAGFAKAVICGGLDLANPLTEAGFSALGARAPGRSRPYTAEREGLHLGEGGGFLLLTPEAERNGRAALAILAGTGETSDAHHISAPLPDGALAREAMRRAMKSAETAAADLDFIHLHGTATKQNDAAEARAVADLGLSGVPAASVKRAVGHTLAGAGAFGAALAAGLIAHPELPLPAALAAGEAPDPALPEIALTRAERPIVGARRAVLVNAFAFGGSNVSLLFKAPDASKAAGVYPAPAAPLLPQSGPMRLVDTALCADETSAETETVVREENLLLENGSFPALGLIEIMAQTVGVFAGEVLRRAGCKPRVGLLLGTRRMTLPIARFPIGTVFRARAEKVFESDDGLWQFDCRVRAKRPSDEDFIDAGEALLTVFNAPDGWFDAAGATNDPQ